MLTSGIRKIMDDDYGIGSKSAIRTVQDQDEKRDSLAAQSSTVSKSRFKQKSEDRKL